MSEAPKKAVPVGTVVGFQLAAGYNWPMSSRAKSRPAPLPRRARTPSPQPAPWSPAARHVGNSAAPASVPWAGQVRQMVCQPLRTLARSCAIKASETIARADTQLRGAATISRPYGKCATVPISSLGLLSTRDPCMDHGHVLAQLEDGAYVRIYWRFAAFAAL